MEADWVRQLRGETKEEGRAFFFKQRGDASFARKYLQEIGRTLDGREWNESPWPVALPLEHSAPEFWELLEDNRAVAAAGE